MSLKINLSTLELHGQDLVGILLNDSVRVDGYMPNPKKGKLIPYSFHVSGFDVLEAYLTAQSYDNAVDLVVRSIEESRKEWLEYKQTGTVLSMGNAFTQATISGSYTRSVVDGAEALLKIANQTRNEEIMNQAVTFLTQYSKDYNQSMSLDSISDLVGAKLVPLAPFNKELGILFGQEKPRVLIVSNFKQGSPNSLS